MHFIYYKVKHLYNNRYMAARNAVLFYYDLFVYTGGKSVHMRYYADKLVFICQSGKSADSFFKRLTVKRSEALVNEHRVESDPAGGCLDFIRKTESE